MFLSKRSNGIYYLWFDDETGRRRKVSTHSNLKTEAFKFLRNFKETETQKRHRVQYITLSHFAEEFLDFARNSYTKKTQSHFQVVPGWMQEGYFIVITWMHSLFFTIA